MKRPIQGRRPHDKTHRRTWIELQPEWLSIDQAPFFFFPEFVAPGLAYGKEIEREVRARQRSGVEFNVRSLGPAEIEVQCTTVQLTINALRGTFAFAETPGCEPLVLDQFKLERSPTAALDDAKNAIPLNPNHKFGFISIVWLARQLWLAHLRSYAEGLKKGHARIVGRYGAISAAFTEIEPDQWRYFDLAGDEERSYARSSLTDELIFSPMVMPVRKVLSEEEKAISDATQYLIAMMIDTQDQPMSRDKTEENLRKSGFAVSQNKFREEIWPVAKNAISNNTYGRVGAPKKSI